MWFEDGGTSELRQKDYLYCFEGGSSFYPHIFPTKKYETSFHCLEQNFVVRIRYRRAELLARQLKQRTIESTVACEPE